MTKVHVGEIRPSQFMFSYGVGSIIDLPSFSVIVDGMDLWNIDPNTVQRVIEDRLLRAVRYHEPAAKYLIYPPQVPDNYHYGDPFAEGAIEGVPVSTFPKWMVCPRCRLLSTIDDGLFEFKKDLSRPEKNRYVHTNCASKFQKNIAPQVVPARVLAVCENGHLDDFPWVEFVHEGEICGAPLLHFVEFGLTGDAGSLIVKCSNCQKSKRVGEAFQKNNREKLPLCKGNRLHLHDVDPEGCNQHVRPIVLGASNSWFPISLNVIAIPVEQNRLNELLEERWGQLIDVEAVNELSFLRRRGELGNELSDFSDEEIFNAIKLKKEQFENGDDVPAEEPDLKHPEWTTFTNQNKSYNGRDFKLKPEVVPPSLTKYIKRLVLVERLREVSALIGFTRLDSFGETLDPDLELDVKRVPIYRARNEFFPANENRGEGIFIQIDEEALSRWESQARVVDREALFFEAHKSFREAHYIANPEEGFPGIRYVMLHSLSHALMRQLSLACGYPVSSIRERLYSATDDPKGSMAGILLYTAAPDSEGTLGGLIEMGRSANFEVLMSELSRDLGFCANDPTCAENEPNTNGQTIHASACHACLFSPETSCERGNKYLDRSLICETLDHSDLNFFAS